MARPSDTTRERIISAASKLFYDQGIRAVSVDAVAAKAGLTKRTLYYHFRSKDDLVAAYLAGRDQPNLALFQRWFAEAEGGVPDKVAAIFRNLARAAAHPKWKGCGFLRTSAELANLPGHPAIRIGRAHKRPSKLGFATSSRPRGWCSRSNWPGSVSCCSTAVSPSYFCTATPAIWRRRATRRDRLSKRRCRTGGQERSDGPDRIRHERR